LERSGLGTLAIADGLDALYLYKVVFATKLLLALEERVR